MPAGALGKLPRPHRTRKSRSSASVPPAFFGDGLWEGAPTVSGDQADTGQPMPGHWESIDRDSGDHSQTLGPFSEEARWRKVQVEASLEHKSCGAHVRACVRSRCLGQSTLVLPLPGFLRAAAKHVRLGQPSRRHGGFVSGETFADAPATHKGLQLFDHGGAIHRPDAMGGDTRGVWVRQIALGQSLHGTARHTKGKVAGREGPTSSSSQPIHRPSPACLSPRREPSRHRFPGSGHGIGLSGERERRRECNPTQYGTGGGLAGKRGRVPPAAGQGDPSRESRVAEAGERAGWRAAAGR
eukprot:scaffold436_cov367-Prasinococcus_capsulatus_cf.AAC.8